MPIKIDNVRKGNLAQPAVVADFKFTCDYCNKEIVVTVGDASDAVLLLRKRNHFVAKNPNDFYLCGTCTTKAVNLFIQTKPKPETLVVECT